MSGDEASRFTAVHQPEGPPPSTCAGSRVRREGEPTLTTPLWCPENEFTRWHLVGCGPGRLFLSTVRVSQGPPRSQLEGALGSLAARDAQRHLGRWRAAQLLLGSPRLPLPRVGPHLALSRCAVSGSWAPVGACLGKGSCLGRWETHLSPKEGAFLSLTQWVVS